MARVPDGLPGAGRPEILQLSRSLWLVVGEVPLDTYGSGQLEAHLADLEWVGRIAVAHEAVVENFARRSGLTVVPMKLFTMFSTRDRALAEIGEKQPEIAAIMRRIAGAQEWGLRVTQRAGAARRATSARRAGTGAEFLAGKKRARDVATHAKAAAADLLQQLGRANLVARPLGDSWPGVGRDRHGERLVEQVVLSGVGGEQPLYSASQPGIATAGLVEIGPLLFGRLPLQGLAKDVFLGFHRAGLRGMVEREC